MTDPLFDTVTPRLTIPLLFAGQAQKELFVNEFAARSDMLLHCAIEGIAVSPPPSPAAGQCWLVGTNPTGVWAGQAGKIAGWQAGNWLFATPCDGMRLLNKSTGQEIRYRSGWQTPARPAAPTGGSTIDTEARAALNALFASLTVAGILPQS